MKYIIVSSTDNKFLNKEVDDSHQPIVLDDFEFFVYQKTKIDDVTWRLSNSNYSIDITEVITNE